MGETIRASRDRDREESIENKWFSKRPELKCSAFEKSELF
jgi:hypothetical protein